MIFDYQAFMKFYLLLLFLFLSFHFSAQMIGFGLTDQMYMKIPAVGVSSYSSMFPYGPQDMDVHIKVPIKYGFSFSPSYTFSLFPGAYNTIYNAGYYYAPEAWIGRSHDEDFRPEYISGDSFLYAEGETYLSHNFYGFTFSYENFDAFEIGAGIQFVRRKIVEVSYDASDDYIYSYTENNIDWYYSYNTFIEASHEHIYYQSDIQFPIFAGYLYNTDYTQMGSYLYVYLGRYTMFGFRLSYSFGINKY